MDCQQTRDDGQIFVYFPISPAIKSGLVYGTIKHNEDYYNCMNVYCTSFERNEELLGTWNCDDPRPSNNRSFWIQLTTQSLRVKVECIVIEGKTVPLSRVVLILYDETFLQSEFLQFSDDWNGSKCSSELCSLLRPKSCVAVANNEQHHEKLADSAVNYSKVVQQLRQRLLQWKTGSKIQSGVAFYNLLFMTLLDLVLGFAIIKLFHSLGGSNQMLEIFLSSVKVIAHKLQFLIESLMGFPVGLKLNRPLSTVLGKFFLYHLYLWETYIDIIKPAVSIIIFIASTFGLIGLSFLMALLSDLITVASLHCYCFYVYAARLYGVTLHGLRSTLRMFGGRKWNPLRSRIDSGEFAWDQLCVGMFIFSSLLLLLPTLLVYYVVFLALRLAVLLLQGTLKRLIWLINSLPTYSILLWFLNSPLLVGDVQFETIPGDDSTLKLVCIKLSLIRSIKLSLNSSAPDYPIINWAKLLNHILSGDLI